MECLPNDTGNPILDQVRYFVINDGIDANRTNKYSGNFNLDFVAWDEAMSIPLTTNDDIVTKTLNEWESGKYYPYPDEHELQNEVDSACESVWGEYYDSQFDTILNDKLYTKYQGIGYYDETSFLRAKDNFERIVKEIAESAINEWLFYYDFDEEEY